MGALAVQTRYQRNTRFQFLAERGRLDLSAAPNVKRRSLKLGLSMRIDWLYFTPWSATAGGVLIGLAAALLILADGHILGASGIVGGVLQRRAGDIAWRLQFLSGLVLAPLFARPFMQLGLPDFDVGLITLIVGGVLVGFGSRLGSGCTSGHGVCGQARLSPRSAVATGIFMLVAFAVVFLMRHAAP